MKIKKCEICRKEVKNLELHIKKYHSDTLSALKTESEAVEYATKNDLDKVLEAITEITKMVNDLTKKQANPLIIRE